MQQYRSTSRVHVAGKVLMLGSLLCGLLVSSSLGEDNRPPKPPLEEPKALLAPVDLIPVGNTASSPAAAAVARASAPPIQLVPEPLPLDAAVQAHDLVVDLDQVALV